VYVYESDREQRRIIRRQFCGARPVGAIFRGAACRDQRDAHSTETGRFDATGLSSTISHLVRYAGTPSSTKGPTDALMMPPIVNQRETQIANDHSSLKTLAPHASVLASMR
jgi:hypothetical protein